ncbi:MAG TPA: acylphosphatase [Bacteroidales bacterium]|nr:acylphosphatase [Bacteroidales bacterium]HSA44215.1 acylphosphatase [Bacteroidales bacterium]
MTSHYTIIVRGLVQKVGFRFHANLEANRNNLRGFVRNEPDGSVHIEAEGDEENLRRFIGWCQVGPRHAVIEQVDIKKGPVSGYAEFVIRH